MTPPPIDSKKLTVSMSARRVAVLYQAASPPAISGIHKPRKPTGYADSGADIAFNLRTKTGTLFKSKVEVITPKNDPDPATDLDWVFLDITEGISDAIARGANTLWLNTILYEGHTLDSTECCTVIIITV